MTRLLPFATLVVTGAAWGATQPLAKVAVSEGYRHFGLIFWQAMLVGLLLGMLTLIRGKRLPLRPAALRLYLFIAVIGTVAPGIASYQAAVHLPSGVLSILLSSVPMFALPIALALGTDRLSAARVLGLLLGLGGVALLVLPEASLPAGTQAVWIAIALIASACYALEGNVVDKWGTQGLDAVQVLTGASILGAALSLPLALASGQFIVPDLPLGAPDKAVIASAALHGFAYSAYVWLVGRAGAVFAAQVSYLVTLFGVTWAMLFLSEAYAGWVWVALILMMAGMTLVQPQRKPLVPAPASGQNAVG
ncbi:DMT family transporter [Antarctobacter heliothermus]|uniref:EamA-like transporter family protein n=1 Tax=Antarctobacter heliothermus TaxID=74033 RepID=A0A239G0T4_9RHOB|nr:DMT family transporter [Antarctobacter heliothermus]SNS62142.1 EamA-like transporter family protein [Antarctobacter heliothermus]